MQSQNTASCTPILLVENRFVVRHINVMAAILYETCLEWKNAIVYINMLCLQRPLTFFFFLFFATEHPWNTQKISVYFLNIH